MKKLLLLFLVLPLWAWGQSSFDGTWKIDVSTAQFPTKPDVFYIKDGMYHCKTCVPPVDIKADGQWQDVSNHPYEDKMMVKVVDDKHVEQASQKNGKEVSSETDVVSDDGKTMTVDWKDSSAPDGKVVTGKATLHRVAAGPAGSNSFSGSWRTDKLSDMPADALTFSFKTSADGIDYKGSGGRSYSAKFNGADVPLQGDTAGTTVSIKKLGANTLQETDKRNGKVVSVAKITVSGNKLTYDVADKERGTTMKFVADKQ